MLLCWLIYTSSDAWVAGGLLIVAPLFVVSGYTSIMRW